MTTKELREREVAFCDIRYLNSEKRIETNLKQLLNKSIESQTNLSFIQN